MYATVRQSHCLTRNLGFGVGPRRPRTPPIPAGGGVILIPLSAVLSKFMACGQL